jgi:hypothetical protein
LSASLETLAASSFLSSGDLAGFRGQAEQLAERQAVASVLIDLSGQQLVNTRLAAGVALPKTQVPWTLAEAETGRPFVTDLFVGAVVGRPLFALAIGVRAEGRLRYLLAFGLETDRMRRILEDAQAPIGWTLSVVDRKNIVVARSSNHDRFVGKPATGRLRHQHRRFLRDLVRDNARWLACFRSLLALPRLRFPGRGRGEGVGSERSALAVGVTRSRRSA